MNWWQENGNLHSLIVWMEEHPPFENLSHEILLEIIDKPWKWTPEWELYLASLHGGEVEPL